MVYILCLQFSFISAIPSFGNTGTNKYKCTPSIINTPGHFSYTEPMYIDTVVDPVSIRTKRVRYPCFRNNYRRDGLTGSIGTTRSIKCDQAGIKAAG